MSGQVSIAKAKVDQRRALRDAALAELPRIVSGSTSWAFLNFIILKCDGRTPPMSAREFAAECGAELRAVQRQLSVLKDRGIIDISYSKPRGHAILYTVSLPYARWPDVEDYAVWNRKRKFLGGWASTPAS